MAITAALCKLQNVVVIGSPLNGGLMEKISPQVEFALFGGNLNTPQMQNLTCFSSLLGLPGQGGEV